MLSADTEEVLIQDNVNLSDKNLFLYCDNNPITRRDDDGELWVSLAIGAGVGVATQLVADFSIGIASGSSFKEIAASLSPIDYVSAAISGALAATSISTAGSVIANAILGGATYRVNCSYKGVDPNVGELITATAIGAVSGRIGGAGVDGKNLRGAYKYSSEVIKTAKSPTRVAKYTAKIVAIKKTVVKGVRNTFAAGIASNFANLVRKFFTKSKA